MDMDGTSTAQLHLSKLQVGVYKFVLQVTDTSNQISKAETHVFVKPENNEAPKANSGGDLEIILPMRSPVLLDGSKSTDDISITKWEWKQIDGLLYIFLFLKTCLIFVCIIYRTKKCEFIRREYVYC